MAHSSLLTILSWLLMIPTAITVLMRVTAFWADDGPGTLAAVRYWPDIRPRRMRREPMDMA